MMARSGVQQQPGILLLAIGVGPLVLGTAFSLVRQGTSLQVFTPIVIGVGASFIVTYAIWRTPVTKAVPALALGVLFVGLIYAVYQIDNYLIFRMTQIAAIQEQMGVSRAVAARQVDAQLVETTGASGFIGFLLFELSSGVIIRSGVVGPAQHVIGFNLLLNWAADVALLCVGSIVGVWQALRRPFCKSCNAYYGHIYPTQRGLERLGQIERYSRAEFVRLFKADHLEQAGAMLKGGKPRRSAQDVLIGRCRTCDTTPITVLVFPPKGGLSGTSYIPSFTKDLSPEQYRRFTTFAGVGEPQPTGGVNRWFVEVMILFAFMVAALFVFSVL